MSSISILLILFVISLFFAGLFAFLETSFTALRLFRLKELEASFSGYKRLFECWERDPQRILITILIANNLAHVSASALITVIMQRLMGNIGLLVGVPIATVMILIFGEMMPKSYAKAGHERVFTASLFIMNILYSVFYPFVSILLVFTKFLFRTLGRSELSNKDDQISEEEIEFLIDYSDEKGIIEAEKSEMLQNIFELGQKLVKEIMVPNTDMKMINVDASLDEALELFSKYRFSRMPVYKEDDEDIVGLIHQKDVFEVIYKKQHKPLKDLVRPISFIPETKKINQLLSEFLKRGQHMAIVIDEHGAVAGLVTLEDVIEQIVGKIRDEHEKVFTQIVPLDSGGWIIDAGISLEDVEDFLGINFQVEESVTLGGFLTEKLQHLPRKGEKVEYEGYVFEVQHATPKRVLQIYVIKKDGEKTATPPSAEEVEEKSAQLSKEDKK